MTSEKRMDGLQIWRLVGGKKKKKELQGSKALVSPAGTASCFGYKGAMLKITIVTHA